MGELAEIIQETEARFLEIAPEYMSYSAEKGFAIQLLNNNQFLSAAAATDNYKYFQQAITNVAAIGLSLNPAEKLAYLIPRTIKAGVDNNGKAVYQTRVYLEPSYMGMIRLATDSGSIKWAQANCVYSNDEFIDNGPGEKPTHKYSAFSKDRGSFVGVYCVAKTCDGDYLTSLMPEDQIRSVMERSEAGKSVDKYGKPKAPSGPWVTDFEEQAKKTVIRRAFKTWPRTNERRMAMLAKAVELSNDNEGFEPILSSPAMGQYTSDQKAYFDQLLERSDDIGLYIFCKSMDYSTMTNLYHSFEKGSKGKYQKLYNDLVNSGREKIEGIAVAMNDATQKGDDAAVKEIIDELSKDELEFLKGMVSGESVLYINEMVRAA